MAPAMPSISGRRSEHVAAAVRAAAGVVSELGQPTQAAAARRAEARAPAARWRSASRGAATPRWLVELLRGPPAAPSRPARQLVAPPRPRRQPGTAPPLEP